MTPKNGKPYVWVTWITGLLAGTDKCQWRAWVKSRYRYEKKAEDPDSVERLKGWVKEHDEMVLRRAERERATGAEVRVEDANSFKLDGQTAVVGGKPDIVILYPKTKRVIIVDEKSGKVKDQYVWQVLLYMFAFRLRFPAMKDWIVEGEVEYKNDFFVPVKSVQLNNTNIKRIGEVLQMIGSPAEPPRAPSKWECLYCDVLECPDRHKEPETEQATDASDYF